jgi:hypothetical protein
MTTRQSVRRPLVRGLGLLLLAVSFLLGVRSARGEPGPQSDLIDIRTGEKKGRVDISPTTSGQGTFVAQVTVNVHDLAPNTTYQVWRAIDFVPDGVYDPTAPGVPFGQIGSITTSAGGAGEAHFVRSGDTPPFVSGGQFDVLLQVRQNDGLTVVLQSAVMTVTVK